MDFKTQNGVSVMIAPADFKDVMGLKSAIAKELSGSNFSYTGGFNLDKDIDFADFAKLALLIDSSPLVYDKIFTCLARCTYDGQRITESTFEDIKAREDYYEIVIACLKENLAPFFKGLLSRLSPLLAKIQNQAENSPT
jgi:hypothetical protein